MAKIRFPKSNSLPFKRMQDYTLLQSDDTRLSPDFDYPSLENPCYFIKHLKTYPIWFQFRSDTDNIEAYLIDENKTEVDVTDDIVTGATLANGTKQRELNLELAAYEGYYKFRVDFLEFVDGSYYKTEYESDWFEIISSLNNTLLQYEWKSSDFKPYDDGMIWSQTQKIWIESRISDYVPFVEKSVFDTESYKLKTTQAQPIKRKNLEIELIPDYLAEKINIALSHDTFYINSVRFNSEETIEVERQGDTRLYHGSIVLQMVEDAHGIGYEDYTDDADLLGEQIAIETSYSLINDTDFSIINDGGDLNKITN
jgi:hypothetical protein